MVSSTVNFRMIFPFLSISFVGEMPSLLLVDTDSVFSSEAEVVEDSSDCGFF